jgi:hypothetical protein
MSLPQLSNSSPDRSWRTHTASESGSGTPCPDSTGPRLSIQRRVLYRIDESKHAVIVQDIQHRSTTYRRR